MANAKIILTFHNDLLLNQGIGFTTKETGSNFSINMSFVWKNLRAGFGQVTIGTPVFESDGERSAISFVEAFNLDWNWQGLQYNVTRNVNVVTIEWKFGNKEFSGFFCTSDMNTNPKPPINSVTAEIFAEDPAINIINTNFQQATNNACQNVKIVVQTNINIKNVISPIISNNINNNTFSFDYFRGQETTITVEDYNGNLSNVLCIIPSILSPNDFNLQLNTGPGVTTLIAENNISQGLIFEYSLDNLAWQTSNTFSGLAAGNYTLYVRDHLGCSTSKNFVVDEYGIQNPYFYISKSNSIRFANRIDFGDAGNYKNDENTLSCEVDVKLPYHEVQLFQTADVITTQFKSNYKTNTAKVIRENGSEVSIPVIKKSTNIVNKDSRDARKYDLGSGKTGVYFTSGNVYDFDTGFPTGETHYLNGGLPIWAKSANYIKVGVEWFIIEDVLFDESKNAEIIVISSNYSGADVAVIAGTIYNIFDYEIYEFIIDMVNYIGENIQVAIKAEDDNFTTINLLSEDISVEVKHEDAFEINYWNDDNTDIFYATGIKHKIRIPYFKRNGDVDDDSDNLKTDATSILLSSELYEIDKFIFEPVTKEIWRKLMIALSHKNVLINGVGYIKDSDFDTEGPLEDTNLYVLTAKMVKTGNVYNSQASGTVDFDSTNVEVPGLIDIGLGGFLKY